MLIVNHSLERAEVNRKVRPGAAALVKRAPDAAVPEQMRKGEVSSLENYGAHGPSAALVVKDRDA